jgi:hypothetical protein
MKLRDLFIMLGVRIERHGAVNGEAPNMISSSLASAATLPAFALDNGDGIIGGSAFNEELDFLLDSELLFAPVHHKQQGDSSIGEDIDEDDYDGGGGGSSSSASSVSGQHQQFGRENSESVGSDSKSGNNSPKKKKKREDLEASVS